MLQQYTWPGNVRELANLVERLAILHPRAVVDSKDLPEKYQSGDDIRSQNDAKEFFFKGEMPVASIDEFPTEGLDMKEYITNIEISLIEQALTKTNNVVARAANMLKMRRTTLVEKMRKYEIERVE